MRRAVTMVAGRSSPRPNLVLKALAGAALLAAVAVGLSLTRASQPTVAQGRHVDRSDARTRSGAADAALRFTQTLAVSGVRDRRVFGIGLRRVAAPGAADRLRASFGAGAAQVRALVGGPSGFLRAAPLGYRVESFNEDAAAVAVWMVALAGGEELEPVAQWRLLTLNLVWTPKGWRASDGSGASGPSPLSPLPVLAAEVSSFREVRHVP
jgi:hypothetical protein